MTVLLTGSTGVVGQALLRRLGHHQVICLTRTNRPDHDGAHVVGDLTAANLGLDPSTRSRLIEQVDTIVHCAAITDFSAGDGPTHDLNVLGTRRMLDLAAAADARMHYVSTAFVARADLSRTGLEGTADPRHYLDSKRAAETVVRESGLPTTIIRPSVVIGDSTSGAITKFQGLHLLIRAVLKNALPLLPLDPQAHIDFIPQDVLAAAIVAVVDTVDPPGRPGEEYWFTAGDQALTTQTLLDLIVAVGTRLGLDTQPPRLVEPDMVDRLVRPVFIDPLPRAVRRRFDDMVSMTALFASAATFPSSLGLVHGCPPLGRDLLTDAFRRSVEHLIRSQRLTPEPVAA